MSEVPLYTQPLIEIIQDVVPVFSLLDLPDLKLRVEGSYLRLIDLCITQL